MEMILSDMSAIVGETLNALHRRDTECEDFYAWNGERKYEGGIGGGEEQRICDS